MSEVVDPVEVYKESQRLAELLNFDIQSPEDWVYMDEHGKRVDIRGEALFNLGKKSGRKKFREWHSNNERIRERVWDFISGCSWFLQSEAVKQFVLEKDPNGLVTLAELWLLVDELRQDFVNHRSLHSLHREEQTRTRKHRHQRILILARWLEMLASRSHFITDEAPPQDSTIAFDETCNALSRKSLKLFRFLEKKKYATCYQTLLINCWKKEVLDESICRAIERLADALNKMDPQYYSVVNQFSNRRASVELLRK